MSAESKRLRAAVIGAGFAHSPDGRDLWGVRAIIPALKALPDQYELVAVCTAHRETAEESARHFNVPHAFWDYHQLLEMTDVDVVLVAVRPVRHHELTMAALAAGKHVYCELPLGINSQQALEMYQLARAKRLCTGVGWQRVHMPSVLRMQELVREGYVGRVLHFSKSKFTSNNIAPRPSHHQWISQVEEGGRSTFRTGDPLVQVSFVLDADVKRLMADAELMVRERPASDSPQPIRSTQVNNVSYLMRMTNEAMGVLHLSMTSWNATGERLEVYGTEGMLMLRGGSRRTGATGAAGHPADWEHFQLFGSRSKMDDLLATPTDPERLMGRFEPLEIPQRLVRAPEAIGNHEVFSVAQALHDYWHAIQEAREYRPSFRDALKIHRVLDAAERSTSNGSWEEPDYSGIDWHLVCPPDDLPPGNRSSGRVGLET